MLCLFFIPVTISASACLLFCLYLSQSVSFALLFFLLLFMPEDVSPCVILSLEVVFLV